MAAVGCGKKGPITYPVTGKVGYSDGSPVTDGMIEFEALEGDFKGRNAHGVISEDGSFFLTTDKRGDGAVAGRHRAIVRGPISDADIFEGEVPPKPTIDSRFAGYKTSGLEFVIKEEENVLEIPVTRPGR